MSKSFRQAAVEELYSNQFTAFFVQSVFAAQYQDQLVHLPLFASSMFPGAVSMLRQTLVPGYVLSVISPTQFDVVVPMFARIGRIRLTLANVDRYKGQFKQAMQFAKSCVGIEPINDKLRWISVKILAEERLPDIIGSMVTIDGRDVGREMVEAKLMERYDPSRAAPPIPRVPIVVSGVYAHEKVQSEEEQGKEEHEKEEQGKEEDEKEEHEKEEHEKVQSEQSLFKASNGETYNGHSEEHE